MSAISNPQAAVATLTPAQQTAFHAMRAFATGEHGAAVMALAGYAGTGKTYLVGALVRELSTQLRIAVVAPTHKAVGVLREKIGEAPGVEFATLHSLLGLRLAQQSNGTYRCLPEGIATFHDYHLVVVDECSMISRELFAQIMRHVVQGTRVLFVGDPAQLPPIEDAGQPSPTFSRVQHQVVLTDVCRQAAGHPAIRLSMAIRDAIERCQRVDVSALASLCASKDSDVLFANGGAITAFNWALHDLKAGHDTRILAWRNEVVRGYNRDIHAALHGDATPFAIGETLLLNEGHSAREARGADPLREPKVSLYSSEETTVRSIERELHPKHPSVSAWRVAVERDNGQRACFWIADDESGRQARISAMFREANDIKRQLTEKADSEKEERRRKLVGQAWALRDDFADARHAYAMTVHKSQGSTFDTAIVDVADLARNRGDEYNQLLYVAATRPRYHLAFIA